MTDLVSVLCHDLLTICGGFCSCILRGSRFRSQTSQTWRKPVLKHSIQRFLILGVKTETLPSSDSRVTNTSWEPAKWPQQGIWNRGQNKSPVGTPSYRSPQATHAHEIRTGRASLWPLSLRRMEDEVALHPQKLHALACQTFGARPEPGKFACFQLQSKGQGCEPGKLAQSIPVWRDSFGWAQEAVTERLWNSYIRSNSVLFSCHTFLS